MRILFLTPYPHDQAPSQRFRFEQYLPLIEKEGWKYKTHSFFTSKGWASLYQGNQFLMISYTLLGFLRRATIFLSLHRYQKVFIHREASPLGPPWVEWAITKVWRKKIIFDFDDAIWLEDPDESGTLLAKLKWKRKVASICQWSWKVSAGNSYLADFARNSGAKRVVINPTTIDTQNLHNKIKDQHSSPLRIGWTGTHSTMQYLMPLVPTLVQLQNELDFDFLVISNREPSFKLPRLRYIPWSKTNEVTDLLEMHIGVMPLTDDPWSKGKCGFKALQYLSLGIPAVVSPVGVNTEIVSHRENGFVASSSAEWHQYLKALIEDQSLRERLGKAGIRTVKSRYSTESNYQNFLSLFYD